jgi:predicted secreted hydrolase
MNIEAALDSRLRGNDDEAMNDDEVMNDDCGISSFPRFKSLPPRMRGRESSVVALVLMLALGACDAPESEPAPSTSFDLSAVLGGDNTAGYLRADAPREFSFPADHGPHPGFRNEWWYFTGNLETEEGRRFGYQVTFFNAAFAEGTAGEGSRDEGTAEQGISSAWSSDRLWMAHVALTDVEGGEHYPFERFSRENPGLAGAALEPFHVWLEDWQLTVDDMGLWHLDISNDTFTLDLRLAVTKAPVLQGVDGLSQKSPESGNASYYYSLTRIATTGTVRVDGETYAVSGDSWLDREWSTSALAADQSGWDWFSLQFDDGQELMYYQLRTDSGAVHANSQGNWTDTAAQQTLIAPQDIVLEELETWTSPTGVVYTTAWSLAYAGNTWRIEAVLDDQWMNLSIPYWEGAVDVLTESGEKAGRGYLEMVRE